VSKNIEDMSFGELVAFGTGCELDDIVAGLPLSKRVYKIMDIATRWAYAQQQKKSVPENHSADRVPVSPGSH
jgi:hypothetical protein